MRKSQSGNTWVGAFLLTLGLGLLGLQAGLRFRPTTLVALGLALGIVTLLFFLFISSSQRRAGGADSEAGLEPESTGSEAVEADDPGPETTSTPPLRTTSQAKSYLLLLACFVPFGTAMLNALEGPFAAVLATITFFLALVLVLVRPPWMSRALAWPMAATALAFVFDAWRADLASYLLGAALSAGLALWMLKASPGQGRVR